MPTRQPFAGEPLAHVVLPARDPTLSGNLALLELERDEFEAELGTRAAIVDEDPGAGSPRLLLALDDRDGPPTASYDVAGRVITCGAADVDGLLQALSLVRTAVREGGEVEATACEDLGGAIERVVAEVADTYPGFELRALDWTAICERHVARVREADDPVAALQSWLAELHDAHTWVREPHGTMPYVVRLDSSATFARVPEGSRAHAVGVEAGWTLASVDEEPVDARAWLSRTAATAHQRPLLAGRRLLAGPVGVTRALEAVSPDGARRVWGEEPSALPSGALVTWHRLASGAAYVSVELWAADRGVDEALDAAFEELRDCATLVLDLRGNGGGNLVLACRARDRFLREPTPVGSIRFSIGGGALSEPFQRTAEPAEGVRRWPGRLVVLTDPLTYSASEDFLLGLQGLDHVLVAGAPSGGGSGRPRALHLLPGTTLTVSTALTYDRDGRCVEGAGIPVDVALDGTDDEVLAVAATL